ncbi:MAG TPA: carboxypeptidase regulatory-like domain-containing protein [bacterium]|jgi:hypothetical protein
MPLWEDITFTPGSTVKYYHDAANQRFVLAWVVVGGPAFELILDANGGVTYQYQTVGADIPATVGVVNCTNTDAFEVCYNGSGHWCPTDSSALQFWGGPQQAIQGTVRHLGGANPPLNGAQVWVTGGADTVLTDVLGNYLLPLNPGTYTVHFAYTAHCDSTRQNVVVEANVNTTLNVALRSPAFTSSVSSLTFYIHQGQSTPQTFTIANTGGSCRLLYSIVDSVDWLSSSPAAGIVEPGNSITITSTIVPALTHPLDHTTMYVYHNASGSPLPIQVDVGDVGAADRDDHLPTVFALHAAYPNPFNPTTEIRYDVPKTEHVELRIYNALGQEVGRLVNGMQPAGRYAVSWNGQDVASGLYLCRMQAGSFVAMQKMLLMK